MAFENWEDQVSAFFKNTKTRAIIVPAKPVAQSKHRAKPKRWRSLMAQLYTPNGDLRKSAYLYQGEVVHPKDVSVNGKPALDFGRKFGVKVLDFFVTTNRDGIVCTLGN